MVGRHVADIGDDAGPSVRTDTGPCTAGFEVAPRDDLWGFVPGAERRRGAGMEFVAVTEKHEAPARVRAPCKGDQAHDFTVLGGMPPIVRLLRRDRDSSFLRSEHPCDGCRGFAAVVDGADHQVRPADVIATRENSRMARLQGKVAFGTHDDAARGVALDAEGITPVRRARLEAQRLDYDS